MRLMDIYAWTLGGTAREGTYSYGSIERPIVWIDAERWSMGGQYLFGTILLNEGALSGMSDAVTDYVFLHEVGHGRLHPLLRMGVSPFRFILMFVAVLGAPVFVGRWLGRLLTVPSPEGAAIATLAAAIGLLPILVPLVVVSWLDEGYAEAFAASRLGTTQYLACVQEIRETSDSGHFKRVLRRLIYPPPRLIVWYIG